MTPIALREGMAEQVRVMHALLLREMRTRFGQHRIGYAWAVVEPSLHIAVLYALRSLMGAAAPMSVPFELWLISGIVPMFLFRGVYSRTIASVVGTRDVLVLAQVNLMDVIWARAFLELATCIYLLIFLFGLYVFVIGPVHIHDPLMVMACLGLLMMVGICIGMLMVTITSVFPSSYPLVGGISRVLYFSSGAFFSVSRLPEEIHAYLVWNPLLHIFENLHAAFFESYHPIATVSSFSYVFAFIVVSFTVGRMLIKRFYRLIIET